MQNVDDIGVEKEVAGLRGRWNDGVAIKPERRATESVRVVTKRSPQAFQKIAKGRKNSQESF